MQPESNIISEVNLSSLNACLGHFFKTKTVVYSHASYTVAFPDLIMKNLTMLTEGTQGR